MGRNRRAGKLAPQTATFTPHLSVERGGRRHDQGALDRGAARPLIRGRVSAFIRLPQPAAKVGPRRNRSARGAMRTRSKEANATRTVRQVNGPDATSSSCGAADSAIVATTQSNPWFSAAGGPVVYAASVRVLPARCVSTTSTNRPDSLSAAAREELPGATHGQLMLQSRSFAAGDGAHCH